LPVSWATLFFRCPNANSRLPEDGIYSDTTPQQTPATLPATANAPQTGDAAAAEKQAEPIKGKKPRVLLTIPSKVISRAQGLAIFTTARAGFQVSGATGSGILIARKPDGTWSPPSGIQVHSVGAGFVIGLDIYDCVVVINTREALEAFTRTRMSLGSDLAVTAGPWGAGGALDFGMPQGQKGKGKAIAEQPQPATTPLPGADEKQSEQQPQVTTGPQTGPTVSVSTPDTPSQGPSGSSKIRKPSPFREVIKNPVYSYVKSRGFYAGVQIDGTVVTERKEANAAFYGAPVSVEMIIRGEVPADGPAGMWPTGAKALFEVLKGAEGWRGQQGQQPQGQPPHHTHDITTGGPAPPIPSTAPAPGAAPGLTAGMQGLKLDGSQAGPSSAFGAGPAPPPITTSPAANAKAAEAAAESTQQEPYSAAPPSYSSPTTAEELPPAYVDDGQYRPPADNKTGQH
jgi:SH3 domain-containing YSC84-like protein 1